MKVFIVVDMEGATGVVHPDQLMPEGRGYAAAQRWLTGDVNAVIRGILRAEPSSDIVVGDGHGIMRNVLLDELHHAAQLVMGPARSANKPLCQCEGIDGTFDLGMMVGFHTRAGTEGGLLAHTFVGSTICNMYLNGRVVGEAEVDAAILGSFGVGVGLIVGNSDLEKEIGEWHASCPFVSTKRTLGPTAAICRPPSYTAPLIEDAAARAVQQHRREPFLPYTVNGPVVLAVELYRREMADKAASSIAGIAREGERTISATGDTAARAFGTIWQAITRAQDEAPVWLS